MTNFDIKMLRDFYHRSSMRYFCNFWEVCMSEKLIVGLRDYFAGQWLSGIAANYTEPVSHDLELAELIATEAYYVADAMLAARDRKVEIADA